MHAPRQEAIRLWRRAYSYQKQGNRDKAIAYYRRSLDTFATPEAFTFLGWALSQEGRLEESIECCRRAIELDPEFGNPYNDIGCYLLQGGKLEEAVPWFSQALGAARYESRHYPHLNLGQVCIQMGLWDEARSHFIEALRLAPSNVDCRKAVLGLIGRFN